MRAPTTCPALNADTDGAGEALSLPTPGQDLWPQPLKAGRVQSCLKALPGPATPRCVSH